MTERSSKGTGKPMTSRNATTEDQTGNLPVNSRTLCQLSYAGSADTGTPGPGSTGNQLRSRGQG
jgi:hypothetical protein